MVWMGLASVCNGHDLIGNLFTFPRIHAWLSSPPELDGGLAGKLSKDVLICIGATNRAIAADYDQRRFSAGNLKKMKLSEPEVQVLYRFRAGTLGGRDPLVEYDLDLLKGRISSALLFPCPKGSGPVEGLGAHLMGMIQSKKISDGLRDMCIGDLETYYSVKWENRKNDWSDPERKIIEQFFWRLAEDKRFGLTADSMAGVADKIIRLSKKFVEFRAKGLLLEEAEEEALLKALDKTLADKKLNEKLRKEYEDLRRKTVKNLESLKREKEQRALISPASDRSPEEPK
jgi:hypothetical protein